MSDCESDLTIDLKSEDSIQKDYSLPSTSSEKKTAYIEKYDSKDLEMDSSVSDNNEDSDSESGERCAICLSLIRGKIGSPDAEGCEHYFCLLCILEWTKNNPTCPQDRRSFKRILVRESICGEIVSVEEVNKNITEEEEQEQADLTYCEVCGSCEREDCLLLCDGCDLGFHLECLSPPLLEVPIEEWFCPFCVAADLPQVLEVKKVDSPKKNDKELTKNQRKKKKKTFRKPRMIPRTRASERVLRRINKTRIKEAKKQNMNEDEHDRKSKSDFQLFKKARPFGRIGDDDVDAAFNQDEYADMLLSSSSSSLSTSDKKDIAVKTIKDSYSIPLPSYSGRSSHPKIENCQTLNTNTDLLINILEEQDILLSKTKDISLTKERKLIKKEGAKSLDFNADRENRVIDLLPSQKKALESKEKDDKYERENSRSRDSRHRKSEEKNKYSKDNFSNGHGSSYKRSYSSPRKSRERDSYSSYKSSKSYRNYDKKLDRRYDQDYRKRDSRRHRERSRSRERKDYNNFSGDFYDRRRSRRSRSKSQERRRTERKHKRRSKTPERHKNKERNHRDKLPASSFWGKDFVNTFTDLESKSSFHSSNGNVSFHSTEVSSTPQKIDIHLFGAPNTIEELPEKKVNKFNEEEELSFETYEISDPLHDKNTFYKSENKEKLESLNLHSKCDDKNNFIEEKRKLEDSDYCSKIESEAKKRRLKNLFGDEESDQDSPVHHLNKIDLPKHSSEKMDLSTHSVEKMDLSTPLINSVPESKKDLLPIEPSKQISELEVNSFQKFLNSSASFLELKGEHEQNILPLNLPPPICLASPSHSCENEQDGFEDITTLSKSSRDLIMKSLFGNRDKQSYEKSPLNSIKTENKDSVIYTEVPDTVEHEKQKSSLNNKYSENPREKFNTKVTSESSVIEVKKNTNNKTSKMFANLFGDSSDSETSNPASDKNSKSTLDQNLNSTFDKNSKSAIDKSLNLTLDKNLNLSLPKSTKSALDWVSKPITEKNLNSILDKNLNSTLDKSLNSPHDKILNSVIDKNLNSTLDKNSESPTINKFSIEIAEQQKTINIFKDLQNDPVPKLLPQKPDIQEKEKSRRMIVNAAEKKDIPEKTNSEGTQEVDPKFSALPTKVKVNKLHLEMRVVDETKKFLNPFYLEKGFSKQIYKEIVSKCVSKVLEVECGNTVDPKKIQKLVNGYVQVYMHRNKKNISNSSSSAPPPKSAV